ncbi:unnamed protein product [Fraxinus pennsylvanica]|uniref:F-box domain-containing protein n=1 Tax=Fraxinus pennsylvanica TaxID=56036 RepID=A0AAD2ABG1_9LAMI|nr:unnamed protein product [Fraxinus pennsylvanica]
MASSENSAVANPSWLELPREITALILHKLGTIEILTSAQKVCTTWRRVCQDVTMWRIIDMRNLGDLWATPYDLVKMCRHAVDVSKGQLEDINIEYFGTDDLLTYISQSSNQLRRLRIVFCYNITCEEAIEVIGRSCPLLKSFKLNNQGSLLPDVECDLEALAVAKNMPNLHHLQLFGNKMTNEGLQAILDGCPRLESLDLRQCFNVSLGGNLGRLCSQRIKDLRRPLDSTDDYGFDAEIDDRESFDEDNLSGISDIDMVSDYDNYLEFSDGSGASYHEDEEELFIG